MAWVDPLTGRLARARITIDSQSDHIGVMEKIGFTATIDVVFTEDPRLSFWVPSGMTEQYQLRDTSACSGEAVYTNYRTFGVETRIIH
jgi:hypothetical protein